MIRLAAIVIAATCCGAQAAERHQFAYISSNVDCYAAGQPARMKFVSQVFAYCLGAVSRQQILNDTKIFFHQVANSRCRGRYSVSFEYVNASDNEAQAEREREQSLRETGYGLHVPWHASVDYASNRCR